MRKRRIGMLLSAMIMMLLAGCTGETETGKTVFSGANINAIILSIDLEQNEVMVKDSDDGGIFGEGCMLDCRDTSVIYCDYETGEVREISLADLSEGDNVIIEIGSAEIQKAKEGGAEIMQIQLDTQRLEK